MSDSCKSTVMLTAGTCWYLWNFRRKIISKITEGGLEVIVLAPSDKWRKPLSEIPGVSIEDWPVSLNGSLLGQELVSLWRGAIALRKHKPDFVLNHGIKANIYIGLACLLMRVPYSNNVTGLGTKISRPGIRGAVLARLYSFASSGSAPLVVQNLEDANVLKQAGLSLKVKIERTMGSGVDLSAFSYKPMPPSKTKIFLFIGRLQYDKGIEDFVSASQIVLNSQHNCRFVVVGSTQNANLGAIRDEILKKWIKETNVEFVGHQEDVRPWLNQSHVVVMPSHGGEGIPKVLLETAATGRPAIVTNVPGCRDAIIPGKTGILCDPQAPESLGKAIKLINEMTPSELTAMGKNAYQLAVEKFSDAHVAEVALNAIAAAIETSQRSHCT